MGNAHCSDYSLENACCVPPLGLPPLSILEYSAVHPDLLPNHPLYNSVANHYRALFGEKVYKLSVNAGFTCPTLDGSFAKEGCLFCNNASFSAKTTRRLAPIAEQLRAAMDKVRRRYGCEKFLAYFQNFSNTYGNVDSLRRLYEEALDVEHIVGLAVSTRPDLISDAIADLFAELARSRYVCVELGLQSIHDASLRYLQRGHGFSEFKQSLVRLQKHGIEVCAHVILGIPGENQRMMAETARCLSDLGVHGVKIHHLQVVHGTQLVPPYERGEVAVLDIENYIDVLANFLEHLSPKVVVHRLYGDIRPEYLIAPRWTVGLSKSTFAERFEKNMRNQERHQGISYNGLCA